MYLLTEKKKYKAVISVKLITITLQIIASEKSV